MRNLRIACKADHVSNISLGESNSEKHKMQASLKFCLPFAVSIPMKAYPTIPLSDQSNLVRRVPLSNYGECAKSTLAYADNMWKVFNCIWRILQIGVICSTQNRLRIHRNITRRKSEENLCVHGEGSKRLIAYSPNFCTLYGKD